MRPLRLSSTAVLLLLLALPAVSAADQEAPSEGAVGRPDLYFTRYEIRYLDVHTAENLVWDQCPRKDDCRVKGLTAGRGAVLDVTANAETHARIARVLAQRDSAPPTQSFQLVVLAAGKAAPGAGKPGDAVPALSDGAAKALADVRGFLPFKSYRMLDTAWVRVTQADIARTQLNGLLGAGYTLTMRFQAGGEDGKKLFLDAFQLKDDKGHDLIQSSFAMNVGETVVVGTSSVSGAEEALVAILTAVP